MKRSSKLSLLLPIAFALAGSLTATRASQAQITPGRQITSEQQSAYNLAAAQVLASDRQAVGSGNLPSEILTYDTAMIDLVAKSGEILRSGDQAHRDEWLKKYNALVEAKARVTEQFLAPRIAQNNIIANALHEGRSHLNTDPCRGLGGQNICARRSSPQGDNGPMDAQKQWQLDQDYHRQQEINGNLPK